MITLNGHTGTYILNQTQGANGKFGGIFKGYRQEDQLAVSAKKLKDSHTDQRKMIENIMTIHHPAIALTIELIKHDGHHYLIREFNSGTDLKTILTKKSIYRNIKTSLFIEMAISLLDGLATLHRTPGYQTS